MYASRTYFGQFRSRQLKTHFPSASAGFGVRASSASSSSTPQKQKSASEPGDLTSTRGRRRDPFRISGRWLKSEGPSGLRYIPVGGFEVTL